MSVGILEPWQQDEDNPIFRVKRSVAEVLVQKGFAVWAVPGRRIRKINEGRLPINLHAPK